MQAPVAVVRARVAALSPAARRFWVWVLAIAVLGLGIRAFWIFVGHDNWHFWGDSWLYKYEARMIADGQWFKDPAAYQLTGHLREMADHPPVFILWLAMLEFLGITGLHVQMLLTAMVGTGTIVVLALLGRRIGGNRLGILVAFGAAIYPNLWINDGMLMSETFFVFFIALGLLCAYRYWEAPSLRRGVILSVVITLAVMTRSEGFLLLPLLVAPVILFTRQWDWPRRLRVAAAAIASFVLIAPWVGYNLSRFDKPVYLAAGDGFVLAAGNCDLTYSGPFLGYWNIACLVNSPTQPPPNADMSVDSAHWRDQAWDYITHHKRQVPKVVLARIGRLWDVFRISQNAAFDTNVEGRGHISVWMGVVAYFAMIPFAIAGAVILRRRKVRIWPFVMLIVVVATVTAAISFGITRYRAAAEISILMFAAVGVDALISRFQSRRHAERPEPQPVDEPETPAHATV